MGRFWRQNNRAIPKKKSITWIYEQGKGPWNQAILANYLRILIVLKQKDLKVLLLFPKEFEKLMGPFFIDWNCQQNEL